MFCNILFWIILPKYKEGEQLFYPFKIKKKQEGTNSCSLPASKLHENF
jgi:hypothetical protein